MTERFPLGQLTPQEVIEETAQCVEEFHQTGVSRRAENLALTADKAVQRLIDQQWDAAEAEVRADEAKLAAEKARLAKEKAAREQRVNQTASVVVPMRRLGKLLPLFGGEPAEPVAAEPKPEVTLVPAEPKEMVEWIEPPGVLNPDSPLECARAFLSLWCWHKGENAGRLKIWQREFWEWLAVGHWRRVDDDTVRSRVYQFLDQAEREIKRGVVGRFHPDSAGVSRVIDALKSEVNLPPEVEQPGWFGRSPVENLNELVSMQNGLLYLPTRELFEHTPRFWSPCWSSGMTQRRSVQGSSSSLRRCFLATRAHRRDCFG
jgi:hypothetical protein